MIKYTELQKQEIIRLYTKEFKSCREIGLLYGTTAQNIWYFLKKNNIETQKIKQLEKHKKDIINSFVDKKICSEKISKTYGVRRALIAKLLQENGIQTNKKIAKEDEKNIVDLYINGKTLKEIYIQYNTNVNTIKKVLKKHNVYKRKIDTKTKQGSFNPITILLFKTFDEMNNTKGLYGYNEKKIENFFVDYFNEGLKLIIEYDENYHTYNLEEDKKREAIIKENFPEFKIIRITEKQLKEKIKELLFL